LHFKSTDPLELAKIIVDRLQQARESYANASDMVNYRFSVKGQTNDM
ncbi:22869_t:CDS:2, partial [Cetraspora pellucida]